MKYKPVEPSSELLRELCCNVGEDMKYVLAEICHHNKDFPKNKITLEYNKGSSVAAISDENKEGDLTFIRECRKGECFKRHIISLINGYGCGLNAAGIKRNTQNEK